MKRKNKENTIVNRIEVDEKTAEPIIVKVPESEILSEEQVEIKKADFFEQKKNVKSIGKQLIMPSLGSSKKEDEAIGKRQKIFKTLFTVIFIVFVVGVLAYTFYNDFFAQQRDFPSWEELGAILSDGWKYLIYALIALFMCYLLKALKLSLMCKSLTGKFHFRTCFETGVIGHYMNAVTPLAVGGQPFEIYHLSRHGVHGGVAAALPIATYALNQFAYVIMGFTFLIMFKYNTLGVSDGLLATFPVAFTVMAIIGLSFCFLMPFLIVLFCLMPRFSAKIVKFIMFLGGKLRIIKDPKKATYKTLKNIVHNAQCIKKIFKRPISATLCSIMSFLEHFALASLAFFTLKMFGFNPNGFGVATAQPPFILEWLQLVQLTIILNLAVSFIPTPGNAGASDLSFYVLFAFGLGGGLAFPAMVIWRFLVFYSFIIIGFIFSNVKKRADRKRETLSKDIPQ